MVRKGIVYGSLGALCYLVSASAFAACAFSPTTTYPRTTAVETTIPLRFTSLSVPPDTEPGTVIYSQQTSMNVYPGWRIDCDVSGQKYAYREYSPLPSLSGYGNQVYDSGIPGIGIRYTWGSYVVPFTLNVVIPDRWVTMSYTPTYLNIELIKTAATVTPTVMSASSLPKLYYYMGRSTSNRVLIDKTSFSGTLQITAPTCNLTPTSASMAVELGTHEKNSFSGIGSGTEWKDASIRFSSCPRFYGNSPYSVGTYNGATFTNQRALTNNFMEITLSAAKGIYSTDSSIMKIDTTDSGSATGVGIQLASAKSVSNKININNKISYTFPTDSAVGALTIPLYARLIQMENTLSAGTVRGLLEYTVSYQ